MYYNKKKKKYDLKKIIIIVFVFITLIIGVVVNIFHTERQLSVFESAIKDSVTIVLNVVRTPFEYINKKSNESKEKKSMYDNYENMKKELELTKLLENENSELKYELDNMKKLLDLNNSLSEYEITSATVIGRDMNLWNETIVIDKGESSGIIINNPVIVSWGLIGKVIKTTTYTSTIRLLTANNSNGKISVKIANGDSYLYGILNGYDKEKNTYKIEGVVNENIETGSAVTTTGLGDIFPSGIIIGQVVGSNTDNFDLSNILEVSSYVDFNNISYVSVLKRNIKE